MVDLTAGPLEAVSRDNPSIQSRLHNRFCPSPIETGDGSITAGLLHCLRSDVLPFLRYAAIFPSSPTL